MPEEEEGGDENGGAIGLALAIIPYPHCEKRGLAAGFAPSSRCDPAYGERSPRGSNLARSPETR